MERRKQCEGKWVFIANNFPLAYLVRKLLANPTHLHVFWRERKGFPWGRRRSNRMIGRARSLLPVTTRWVCKTPAMGTGRLRR